MRQAGRVLPEYRALRDKHTVLDICRTPELAAQVTLQPLHRFDVDAAILFSEMVLVLEPMGLRIDSLRGDRPAMDGLVRSSEAVDALRVYDAREELPFIAEAVRIVSRDLGGQRPLLGFAGAPYTLACYAVDGNPAAGGVATRALMYGDPATWHRLCEKLATVAASVLRAQVEAGAQALQLFDSWVGTLAPDDYRQFVLPHSRRVFEDLADLGVPTIHFGTGNADLLEVMREAGGDVIGIDWRVPLDEAWERVGYDRGIQGNLDPALLLGPMETLLAGTYDVLARAEGRPGHIFNLGHGLLPSTPIERVQAVTRYIHAHSS